MLLTMIIGMGKNPVEMFGDMVFLIVDKLLNKMDPPTATSSEDTMRRPARTNDDFDIHQIHMTQVIAQISKEIGDESRESAAKRLIAPIRKPTVLGDCRHVSTNISDRPTAPTGVCYDGVKPLCRLRRRSFCWRATDRTYGRCQLTENAPTSVSSSIYVR